VTRVSFVNVPSFVLHPAVPVRLGARPLHADVAFGGAFYAIVDSEAAGIPIVPERLPELRAAGMAIKHAVEQAVTVVHPTEPGCTASTARSSPAPLVRSRGPAQRHDLRRGRGGPLALRHGHLRGDGGARRHGLLGPEQTFTHESIIGTTFRGRVVGEQAVAELPAIVPELEGEAFITGESSFIIDEADPLRYGFRL
jgi:proline racemase